MIALQPDADEKNPGNCLGSLQLYNTENCDVVLKWPLVKHSVAKSISVPNIYEISE